MLPDTPKQHLLTVGLEDYFQVAAFRPLIEHKQWYRFETRLEQNTRKALDLLDRFDIHATFFVNGWVGDRFPELVRLVADRGHEIADKGYYHRTIRQMTPSEFREDLAKSREALERACGQKVVGYRVSHGWFTPTDLWALDVLADEGYAYDASLAPAWRRFAGEPWRRFQHEHIVRKQGLELSHAEIATSFSDGERSIWEFPRSSYRLLGIDIPIAGGNYFRQFPQWLVKRAVAAWHRRVEAPFVMYFHVWELDPEQPKINAVSFLQRIRHYRNLDKMERMLEDYFGAYSFTGIADYLGLDTHAESGRLAPKVGELSRSDSATPAERNGYNTCADRATTARTPIGIVVPCFNEEHTLPYLANTLRSVEQALSKKYDARFLFVDDGSTDATAAVLRRIFADWPNATILQHDRNRGVAAAILTGACEAKTEIVCSIDCDCTYDPHELEHMVPLLTGDVDLVTASPYHRQGRVRNVPRWRLGLSRGASWLYRRILRHKLATYTSCFRVYRRSALVGLRLREPGYLGIAEMLGRLDLQGSKIVEYPTTLEVRVLGRSKMKTVRTIFGHLRLMARLFGRRLVQRFAGQVAAGESVPVPQTESTQPERTTA